MKLLMLSHGLAGLEKATLETDGGKFVEVEVGTTGNVSVRVYQDDTDRYGEVHIFKAAEDADRRRARRRWFITWQTKSQTYYNAVPAGSPSVTDHCVCQDCVTPRDERRIELDEVSVWEEGSDGWEGPMTCDRCGRDLGVIVNGKDGG
jgi:hypothetical protein